MACFLLALAFLPEKINAGLFHIDPAGFVVFGYPGLSSRLADRFLDAENALVPVDAVPFQPAHFLIPQTRIQSQSYGGF